MGEAGGWDLRGKLGGKYARTNEKFSSSATVEYSNSTMEG